MKFVVQPEVFEALPNACFGAVIARRVDNTQDTLFLQELLQTAAEEVAKDFKDVQIKESEYIKPYREAFQELNINPNKYPPSIESLITRISKGKGMPSINTAVDMGNIISLQHRIPVGAHAISGREDEGNHDPPLEVRFSREDDGFVPFGKENVEKPDSGELIYAVGDEVRTRKWIWRQSERGKITASTQNIIFPMDGFIENRTEIEEALEDLSNLIEKIFHIMPVHATVTAETHNVISVH